MPTLCSLFGDYGAGIALFIGYSLALILISNIICFNLYGYLLTSIQLHLFRLQDLLHPYLQHYLDGYFCTKVRIALYLFRFNCLFGLVIFFHEELKVQK